MSVTFLEKQTSLIARDLRLNLHKVLGESTLSPEEGHLALLAGARSLEFDELAAHAREQLEVFGVPPEQIQEASESAALVGMLNTYYRFRHFVGSSEEYRSAGLRMTALVKPLLGKERFEMVAFVVSVINGCEACTQAHKKELRSMGVSTDKVHDLARLASIVKGLSLL